MVIQFKNVVKGEIMIKEGLLLGGSQDIYGRSVKPAGYNLEKKQSGNEHGRDL